MIITRKLKKSDPYILYIVVCLVVIGTIAVYGATSGTKLDGLHIENVKLFVLFCVPLLLVAVFDYRLLIGKLSYFLYGFGIGLLLLVKWYGESINGAVRWLQIGAFQLQPSELVKIFTVLLAAHMLRKRGGEKLRLLQDLVPVGLVFLIPIILIMQQPDLGTSIVFLGALLGMLWMGNIRITYMLLFISVSALLIGTVFWLYFNDYEMLSKLIKPHQMSRIQTFLDPGSDPDKSWHVMNAIKAISLGGINGESGFYLRNGYIPYAYSDSIYVVIGEKYGFIGSSVLLLLYFMLVYRFIHVIIGSKDLAGSYLVVGLTGMLVLQIFVNIGMHIGLVPLTGISLPFISYGGSSLLTNMIAIGLILSVKIHKDDLVIDS